jgi:hypothetical protein
MGAGRAFLAHGWAGSRKERGRSEESQSLVRMYPMGAGMAFCAHRFSRERGFAESLVRMSTVGGVLVWPSGWAGTRVEGRERGCR